MKVLKQIIVFARSLLFEHFEQICALAGYVFFLAYISNFLYYMSHFFTNPNHLIVLISIYFLKFLKSNLLKFGNFSN